jgi:rod shape-determining protein MreD
VNRRRQIFLAVVVALAFLLQLAVLPQFKLLGAQPDLILVVAVLVAVTDGPLEGALVGFFGGLLQDIASPQVLGVGAFSKALAAFMAGMLKDFFMTYSILLPVMLVFLMSLLEQSLHQGALAILGQEQLPPFKVTMVFASALYDVLAVFILYPLLKRFRFRDKEESTLVTRVTSG